MSFRQIGVKKIIRNALDEDIGSGDVTTSALLNGDEEGTARAIAKEDMVIAGIDVFREVFREVDDTLRFGKTRKDGEDARKGDVIEEITGSLKSILLAERTALNIFQRMCGVATATRQYVNAVEGTKAKILDTRKTPPGMRILDKYAVRTGGGVNHRIGLYGGVLIKDNHIMAAGSIRKAVERVRKRVPLTLKIEVEAASLADVEEALAVGVDIIMLDNMDVPTMAKAVGIIGGRAIAEASGRVRLETVREIAETGVDYISIGALTHSVKASDISLLIA